MWKRELVHVGVTMFDSQIALAEIEAFGVMLSHNVRHLVLHKDKAAIKKIMVKLGEYSHLATMAHIGLKRGDNWQLRCTSCTFELPPNVKTVNMCPTCHEQLKYWSLNK